METLQAIFSRRSVRRYSDRPVSPETLRAILCAGMAGPSCVNARDWCFVVVQNKQTLAAMADANGDPARPLRSAAAGILVCGDLARSFPPAPDYWVIDGAIAAQNMVLAAQALGVGSVWLGTWLQQDRVARQAALFGLPEFIVPHSILALGYPESSEPVPLPALPDSAAGKWEADRVHWELW